MVRLVSLRIGIRGSKYVILGVVQSASIDRLIDCLNACAGWLVVCLLELIDLLIDGLLR